MNPIFFPNILAYSYHRNVKKKENKEEKLMTPLSQAIAFAVEHHDGQLRKNGTPYLYHPLKVAETLMSAGYDETYQIVGILHDVLEDTDATYEQINERFGDEVADAVLAITRLDGEDESHYVQRVLQNDISAVVKNVDKLDNLNDIIDLDKETALKYVKKAKEYYYMRFSSALDTKIKTTEFRLENNIPFDDKKAKLKKGIELYPKLSDVSTEVLDDYDYFYCLSNLFRIKDFDSAAKKFGDVDVERFSRRGWRKCKKNFIEDYDDISRISIDEAREEVNGMLAKIGFVENIE